MRTPGSGRKPGTPNRTTREMRERAQEHFDDAIAFWAATLADPNAPFEHKHESAIQLRDTGFGKPSRAIELQAGPGHDYFEMSDEELALRAEHLAALLRGQSQLRIPERTDVEEGLEVVDGGICVPDPAAEPHGVALQGAEPKEPQPNDL